MEYKNNVKKEVFRLIRLAHECYYLIGGNTIPPVGVVLEYTGLTILMFRKRERETTWKKIDYADYPDE